MFIFAPNRMRPLTIGWLRGHSTALGIETHRQAAVVANLLPNKFANRLSANLIVCVCARAVLLIGAMTTRHESPPERRHKERERESGDGVRKWGFTQSIWVTGAMYHFTVYAKMVTCAFY